MKFTTEFLGIKTMLSLRSIGNQYETLVNFTLNRKAFATVCSHSAVIPTKGIYFVSSNNLPNIQKLSQISHPFSGTWQTKIRVRVGVRVTDHENIRTIGRKICTNKVKMIKFTPHYRHFY